MNDPNIFPQKIKLTGVGGDSRPRSVMQIQHAIWYIMATRFEIETIDILMRCLPQRDRSATLVVVCSPL
jgi:hypothetical protein